MLEAIDVGHRYPRGRWLFRNVNLTVEPGSCLAILGPNARGKTTLLTCLANIRKPAAGRVESVGGIGYVPQNTANPFRFTTFDIVLMGTSRNRSMWSTPSTEDEEKAAEALRRVGMGGASGQIFASLSGGQRQLALIARALASDPTTLILDEPTAALDMRNQARTLSIMKQICEEGIGVVFTTHDPTHALQIADHAMLMDTDITCEGADSQLTEDSLSQLYQIPVKTPGIEFDSGHRKVVVPDLLNHEGG
ncbi:MAG: ABC transporter ATP-binding protein [Actinomycetaceae bacterium]|nr:ABC transporter ATP-binding protein [Actinomycetaceae bacterium]